MKKYFILLTICITQLSGMNNSNSNPNETLSEVQATLVQIQQSPYYTDGKNVYLHLSNKYNNSGFLISKNTPDTLRVISESDTTNYDLDESAVYSIDLNNKFLINNGDNSNILMCLNFVSIGIRINGVSPDDFKYLDGTYFISAGRIFSGYKEIVGADAKAFKTISEEYASDKKNIYYMDSVILNSDPRSFKIIDTYRHLTKDKNHIYLRGKALDGADPKSFKIINEAYYKDNKQVWAFGNPLADVNPNTFRLIPYTSYSTDGKNVYFQSAKVEGADAETFRVDKPDKPPYHEYGIDKNHVYVHGERIDSIDVKTFQPN